MSDTKTVATATPEEKSSSNSSFAIATLRGNVGKQARLIKSVNDKEVMLFNLAVNQHADITDWHSVSIWNKDLIEFAKKNLSKGKAVYMKCRITTGNVNDENDKILYTKTYLHPYFMSVLDKENHVWKNSDGTTKKAEWEDKEETETSDFFVS